MNRPPFPRKTLLGLAAIALVLLALPPSASAADWTLDKEQDGIVVHTRPVEGSGIREFRGVAEVGRSVESILALLRDSDRFSSWFPNCPESKLLEREGNVSYQYSVMDSPWPVSDRDNVWRSVLRRSEDSGRVEIELTAAPDKVPERDGRVRVRQARGAWLLEPVGPDRTRVTFLMHLEPGGGIPDWLINSRVVETPFEALTNLRRAVDAD